MPSRGPDDSEPVPRLPRTRGFKLSAPVLIRIAMTGALLVMVVMTQEPCADAVSGFVTGFDEGEGAGSGSAAVQMPRPGTVDVPSSHGSAGEYEQLRPDMTEAELKAAIERAKARADGDPGSAGSAARADGDPGSAGSAARADGDPGSAGGAAP